MHVGNRFDKSQCRHCGAELPSGANYCLVCGTGVTSLIVDPLGLENASVPIQTNESPVHRRGLFALLTLVVGMLVVLWALGRDVDQPERARRDLNTPEETASKMVMESTESTTAPSTTTTTPKTTTTEQQYVNRTPGPVLGDDVGGVLVQVARNKMHRIDLATGAIERIDLEHTVNWAGPESEVIIDGKLISSAEGGGLIFTDLTDGSQTEPSVDGYDWVQVLGQAGPDSAWVGSENEPDGDNVTIEVGLDGEVRRRVDVPQPFWIGRAEGDDLLLEGIDGWFRYETDTGTASRLPGSVVAFSNGVAVMASCDESLQCKGLIDRGSGPEAVDWLDLSGPNYWWYGSVDLSPDLTGALVHRDDGGWGGSSQYTYIDLSTGSTRDLGEIDMEPWLGAVWVEHTPWIVGRNQSMGDLVAVNTETAEQITPELAPYRVSQESYLAFIPAEESISAQVHGP